MTVCGFCHRDEVPAPSVSFTEAFASAAFQPRSETHVAFDSLVSERQKCDFGVEPHRCGMYSAQFDGGPVSEEAFPSAMATFF